MELKKQNIHRDRIKCQINTQITLEEDKNISDRSPDVVSVLLQSGKVILDEIRPVTDNLMLRGKLQYEILCVADNPEKRLFRIQGEIPLEEKIRVEGLESIDNPQVQVVLEDFRVGLINSRKVNVRALVNFCITVKELYDDEFLIDISGQEAFEIKRKWEENSVLVIDKKDVFRIKEDLELPSFLPPIGEVLWKNLELGRLDIKVLEDNIGLQGDLHLFVLYASEGEMSQIKSYETTIPFSGNVECQGCGSSMIGDILPYVSYQNLSVKPDYDGEDRMLEVEMVLDIPIQIYDNRQVEMITDVYGTEMELVPEYTSGWNRLLEEKHVARVKISQEIKTKHSDKKVMQVCHMNSSVQIEDERIVEEGLEIHGIIVSTLLYMVDGEEDIYEALKKEIPFSYLMEEREITKGCKWKLLPTIEQQNAVILDESTIEVKMILGLEILVENCQSKSYISSIQSIPYSQDLIASAPGIIVYIPSGKEELWEIGKRNQVSIKSIKEINDLSGEEVEKGTKILLVKG